MAQKKNDRSILQQFGSQRIRKTSTREIFLVRARVYPQKQVLIGRHRLLLCAQTLNTQGLDVTFFSHFGGVLPTRP